MALGSPATQYSGRSGSPFPGNGNGASRILERVHSVSYHATDHKLILDVEAAQKVGSVKTATVGDITIQNTGGTPAFAILAYKLWTGAATTDADTVYHLNYLLKPGESIYVPDSPAVIADETIEQLTGTVVTDAVPSSDKYADSGANLAAHVDSPDTTITVDNGDFFRVGDLIQLGDDSATISKIEIMEVTAILANVLTVTRGLYGSNINDKDVQTDGTDGSVSGANIYFPFFNTYGDYDGYSVVQTDNNGKYKSSVFPITGLGRAGTHLMGFTPGSIAVKFYSQGYQELGLSGITSSTNSGLTASTAYKIDITVDGGTLFQDLTFTTDTSNLNFGGTNGIISKIQSALDTQYYTAGNLFEKKVTVGIVNGDIRFTSASHLSTSAILLADTGDGNSFIDAAANGRIPGVDDINAAVPARLPNDTVFDPITYSSSPNTGVFMYDDGNGRLFGMGNGTINYETGAWSFVGLPNAEFVVSCLHTSAFSGRQDATDTVKMNSLKAIYGNTPNQKWNGELTVTRS